MKSRISKSHQRRNTRPAGQADAGLGLTPRRPEQTATAPSTPKDGIIKVVEEIKAQLENDAKNVGIQAARLILIEDFLRFSVDADKKPVAPVLSYTT